MGPLPLCAIARAGYAGLSHRSHAITASSNISVKGKRIRASGITRCPTPHSHAPRAVDALSNMPGLPDLTKPEVPKHEQHDDHKSDNINDRVHVIPRLSRWRGICLVTARQIDGELPDDPCQNRIGIGQSSRATACHDASSSQVAEHCPDDPASLTNCSMQAGTRFIGAVAHTVKNSPPPR